MSAEYERGRIAGYEEAAKDTTRLIQRLNRHEVILIAVKATLESDSIEYDDIRNLLTMIDGVLNPVDIKLHGPCTDSGEVKDG